MGRRNASEAIATLTIWDREMTAARAFYDSGQGGEYDHAAGINARDRLLNYQPTTALEAKIMLAMMMHEVADEGEVPIAGLAGLYAFVGRSFPNTLDNPALSALMASIIPRP